MRVSERVNIKKRKALLCLYLFVLSIPLAANVAVAYTKKELLVQLVKQNDENISNGLRRQLNEKSSAYYGVVYDNDSILSPIGTAGLIQNLLCGYVSRDSKFYQSREILERMILAGNAMLKLQHSDGTIDLLTTNFHSTPDLGFTIYPLAISYSIMLQNKNLNYGELPSLVKQYLLNAGKALAVGGIHTPNHRWVVCGALAWINSFFPDSVYKNRVDQWLAEGIDIDPDGQYNERSTAVYTPITNGSLLTIAKKMNYDYLYDIVRRNLNLTFYLIHSNGEIVTETSNRQDKYINVNMSPYYMAYNYMAIMDKSGKYSGMVNFIQETAKIDQLSYMLPRFLEDSSLLADLPSPSPIPTSYHIYLKHSDIVRIREGNVDMSIITNNPTFFTYFKGNAALEGMRLSSAFFGKGQFESAQLEKVGDSYILSSTAHGPYYQPLSKDQIPDSAETWRNVPRTDRDQSEIQTLLTKITITPKNGKVTIKVSIDGPTHLPVTLELGFRQEGTLQNATPKKGIKNAFLINSGGYATYQKSSDKIKIGPGIAAHKWTQLRGALPKLQADCLYLTNYAPCEFEFTIE